MVGVLFPPGSPLPYKIIIAGAKFQSKYIFPGGSIRAIGFQSRLNNFNVKNQFLADKLKAGLPEIMAWAVKGCLEWQRQGLGIPEEVKTATEVYRGVMGLGGETALKMRMSLKRLVHGSMSFSNILLYFEA